ncbi:MAG TPA: DNA repair exonuclease [Clostridia bacterium]|nr:DNA repair exonuclease [Clostridia bacterium]
MKILHCSDIHLGAPLAGLGENAALRRRELLESFCGLVTYAKNNADAMIVAGDLFDSGTVDNAIFAAVADAFYDAEIPIFLLFGNHDKRLAKIAAKNMPENVKIFDKQSSYELDSRVVIHGIDNAFESQKVVFDNNKYNILVLHGDQKEIDFSVFASEPIDYVAMGHYHKFSLAKFSRGLICYCGSNEPRDFGDIGETGFIMLDTNKNGKDAVVRHDTAKRHMITKNLDVTGLTSLDALLKEYAKVTAEIGKENYLNLIVCGRRNPNVDIAYLSDKKDFFATRITDETALDYDREKLRKENSLIGEFIKAVEASGNDENIINRAIELGLIALEGKR